MTAPAQSSIPGRTGHACSQCRDRKQKCGGFTHELKCRPCTSRKVKCSFEDEANDPRFNPYLRLQTSKSPSAASERPSAFVMDHLNSGSVVSDIPPQQSPEARVVPQQMELLLSRIADLERRMAEAPKAAEEPNISPHPSTTDRTSEASFVQAVMSTQQTSYNPLNGLPSPQATTAKDGPLSTLTSLQTEDPFESDSYDPIARGILTEGEAHVMFRLYFSSCHLNAPFLDLVLDSEMDRVRTSSMILFLSILSVGARFWGASSRASCWLHPRYSELVQLLDMEVMRVTLRPGSGDLKLETVQALMLCAHWMPFDVCANKRQFRSRFSEAGAWQCLGLAIRFHQPENVTRDDIRRYRTMLYLTESDHYLALSARRPPMLNPRPLHDVLVNFLRCKDLQSTDVRLTSLFRVAHRAQMIGCRPTTIESVEAFDKDVQIVEKHFISSLGDRSVDALSQHFPFTSLRWYRLSYTCAFLDAVDMPQRGGKAMSWAIEWAGQILVHLTSNQSIGMLPPGSANTVLEPDPSAVSVMSFAIDHYFVVVTYAAFFLVNSWLSNHMDWNLQYLQQPEFQATGSPKSSYLYRLVDLAARTLEAASPPEGHLARRYVALLRSMMVLIENGRVQPSDDAAGAVNTQAEIPAVGNLEGDFWEMWQQAGLEPIVWPNLVDGWFDPPRIADGL